MVIRAHIFVEGRVQGVFYRAWTRENASKLGLTGWVKNLADGRVEAVFEGEKKKVEEMVKKCQEGSRAAKPTHVDVNMEEATGEFEGFEIKY